MSGITLKRAASVLRIVSRPFRVRPTGSGPRASQNVASSVKNETMRSTSRLLKAAEIAFMSSGVAMSAGSMALEASGMRFSSKALPERLQACREPATESPPHRTAGRAFEETRRQREALRSGDAAGVIDGHLDRCVAAH